MADECWEKDFLKRLLVDAEEAVSLFSNEGQELQERTIVAGLLRVLSIDFQEDEIMKQGPEPIDIWYRDARFQVTEILDEGRPRDHEIRKRRDRVKRAKRLEDILEPGTVSSNPVSPDTLFAIVSARCRAKAEKYGGNCSDIDLLIYVNLHGKHLYPTEPFHMPEESELRDWRSVSFIMERYAMVLCANDTAPSFLITRKGQLFLWEQPDTAFPKLGGG